LKDGLLTQLIEQSELLKTNIPALLKKLLTEYHLSLVYVLGEINSVPIHKSITIGSFSEGTLPQSSLEGSIGDIRRDQFLRGLTEDPRVLEFIGDPRSIDSRVYEDVIIGTKGSILRSEDLNVLLSFHAYNRALHLFLEKYNFEIEKAWNTLNDCKKLVDEFEKFMSGENVIDPSDSEHQTLLSSDQRKNLRVTRLYVLNGIKNIDHFIVLTSFIEESIGFTIENFSQLLESGEVKENSFHIRKVLRTLQDRAKHLEIVSENFSSRGRTLISRLELYDSEIAFESQKKIERTALLIGLIGIILAIITIFEELLSIISSL